MTTLPSAQHCLDLNITVTQQFMGHAPGGYRIDLYYSGERAVGGAQASAGGSGPIRTQPGVFSPELSLALDEGHIQSGSDWASVTSRGVLELDGNLTLMLRSTKNVACPLAGRLRGRALLRDVRRPDGRPRFDGDEGIEAIFAVWQQGFDEGAWLPLVLSASFEVPIFGFGEDQTQTYEHARELGSSLFIGLGKATFASARHGTIKSIALGLHRFQHPSLQAGGAR